VSALRRTGSTRRWRRIRLVILGRDSSTCQVPAASGPPPGVGSWAHVRNYAHVCGRYATHVDHAEDARAGQHPDAPDDLDDLRALCSDHNLTKGRRPASEFDNQAEGTRAPAPIRWEW